MGQKPMPTALKLVRTTRDKRGKVTPERFKNEPKAEPGIPDPPDELSPMALAEWHRIARPLYNLGVLTKYDRAILSLHCQYWGRWQEAERIIGKEGALIKGKSGHVMQHPAVALANKASMLCAKYASELGLTPSARTRIDTTGLNARAADQTEERDEFEDIFG